MIIEVDFNGTAKKPNPKFCLKKQDVVFCSHNQLEIDHHKRILSCEKCGKVLDAYDYIHDLAVKELCLLSNIKKLQKDVQEFSVQRDALKAQVSRLKSDAKKLLKNQAVSNLTVKPTITSSEAGKICFSQIKQGLTS